MPINCALLAELGAVDEPAITPTGKRASRSCRWAARGPHDPRSAAARVRWPRCWSPARSDVQDVRDHPLEAQQAADRSTKFDDESRVHGDLPGAVGGGSRKGAVSTATPPRKPQQQAGSHKLSNRQQGSACATASSTPRRDARNWRPSTPQLPHTWPLASTAWRVSSAPAAYEQLHHARHARRRARSSNIRPAKRPATATGTSARAASSTSPPSRGTHLSQNPAAGSSPPSELQVEAPRACSAAASYRPAWLPGVYAHVIKDAARTAPGRRGRRGDPFDIYILTSVYN